MGELKFHPDDFLRIRKEKNLTQKQLAKLSGLSVTSIKNFEQGKTVPKYETVVKLCHGLDTDVCNVFYDDEEAKQWERLGALNRMVEAKTKEQLQRDYVLSLLHKRFLREHFGHMKYMELAQDFILWMKQNDYMIGEEDKN